MTKKTKTLCLALGLGVLVAGCGLPSNISKETAHGMANARMESMIDSKADNPVHTIAMPHDEPVFPPGPGRDEFVTACVVCHSPRYITMQPRFSRNTWLGEVNKMKDVYGALITDEQAPRGTEYLVTINRKTATGLGQKGTYGE